MIEEIDEDDVENQVVNEEEKREEVKANERRPGMVEEEDDEIKEKDEGEAGEDTFLGQPFSVKNYY